MDIFTTEGGKTVPCLSDEKCDMAVPSVVDIAYLNERNMTFSGKIKKLSQLYTYINAPSLSQFPPCKTVFKSSASSCDRQTREDKFVDIVQQL